ncbi:flagellin [Pseudoalteromonas luteoviolacea]|nr:flagellin [Pseudoalteromonas luteoviolacea]MBQ4906253.1 flagellin [Pseudoalteromonas luteoviolacea]
MSSHKTAQAQETLTEQLSTGKRINSAKDDAAGLQISNRLTTQALVKEQTQRNINDGISYGQVADTALSEVTELLQRMRVLALQAANGSNSDEDRIAINLEMQQNIEAIDGVAMNTEIFGKKPLLSLQEEPEPTPLDNVQLLNEAFSNGISATLPSGYRSFGLIPAGSTNVRIYLDSYGANDDLQLFNAQGQHLIGKDLSHDSANIEAKLFTSQNGYHGHEKYDSSLLFDGGGYNFPATNMRQINGMNFTFSGDGHGGGDYREEVIIDEVTEHLLVSVTEITNGAFEIRASWDSMPDSISAPLLPSAKDGPMLITAKDDAIGEDGYVIFDDIDASAQSLNIAELSADTQAGAQASITAIDAALKQVGQFRADIGAKMNALESIFRNQSNQHTQLSTANQKIVDADFAYTMTQNVKQDILKQSQIAITTQAKQAFQKSMTNLIQLIG